MLAVTGPTASGKSELAIRFAQELSGEIVNIDSVQIYKDFWIGSAKVPEEQRCGVPHHLVDFLDPNDRCDAARFASMVWDTVREISSRNKLPILVGGGGMYFTSIVHGLAELPAADPKLRAELEALPIEDLRTRLEEKDPAAAERIQLGDRMRTIRALETAELTEKPISGEQKAHNFSEFKMRGMAIAIWPEREVLYNRINERTAKMVAHGLLQEAEDLLKKYGREAHPFGSLGYRQALEVIEGTLAEKDLVDAIATKTRQFAKRQSTYWNNEPEKRGWKPVDHPLGSGYRVFNLGL